jgi:cupin fold WbuC family metalloprotein
LSCASLQTFLSRFRLAHFDYKVEARARWPLAAAGPTMHPGGMSDSPVQILDSTLFVSLIERARQSPRLRTNHNFHRNLEDNPHRFLNVMVRGTYLAPHRHRDPPKSESFLVLEGELGFYTFDDAGQITSTLVLGRDAWGVDIQPGVWHTIAVLTEHVVCFEVKPGPYLAANDKDFARWAPREGDPGAGAYLDMLISRVMPPVP